MTLGIQTFKSALGTNNCLCVTVFVLVLQKRAARAYACISVLVLLSLFVKTERWLMQVYRRSSAAKFVFYLLAADHT
jgi:hypothetical protein